MAGRSGRAVRREGDCYISPSAGLPADYQTIGLPTDSDTGARARPGGPPAGGRRREIRLFFPCNPVGGGRKLTTIQDPSNRRQRSRSGPNDVRALPVRPHSSDRPDPTPNPPAGMTVTPPLPIHRSQTNG